MIFLDLTKVYDALDRSRSLEILKGCGVGKRVRQLLGEYWDKSAMVARAGGYYGTGFKGERGVTQGDPLSPTIFNVVVDAVVRHWVTLAVKEAETRGGAGEGGQAPDRPLLLGRRHGSVVRPPLATVGVFYASRIV